MITNLKSLPQNETSIIYDGQCPFCTAYTRLLRLRDAIGPVLLIDARAHPDLIAEFDSFGLDLNEGMAVLYEGRIYFGSDAMHLLSTLSTKSGIWNRCVAAVFRRKTLAGLLYPLLKAGRSITLVLLNRQAIKSPKSLS